LVFEGDVLPDGTEVAYYAHGQVALVEIGSVIFFLLFLAFTWTYCTFVLWSETVGWLQKGIWDFLYLLQL